jgi:Ca2+-binding RTX toxin-like protein
MRLYTDSNGYLNVVSLSDANDVVRIRASTSYLNNFENRAGEYVEELVFDDATIDLTGGLTLTGGSSGDNIFGTAYADVIDGAIGDDTLYGNGGNDTLGGGADNDYLYGGAGNDTLNAGDGADMLYGEGNSDTFRFGANTTSDTIADFSLGQNDKIDISQLIETYDPVTHAITDWVEITTNGWDSILKIDADGGGNSFVQIATISGVTGLTDEAALVSSGHLIAA